jgi:hypothetical protein
MVDNPPSLTGPNPTPEAVAAELEQLADRTGDPAYRRAARSLCQQQSRGRPAVDDTEAIAEALAIFEAGQARTLNSALRQVARTMAPREQVDGIAERLRRKIVKAKKSST